MSTHGHNDLDALQRLLDEEAERRRRVRFGANSDALRAVRVNLGLSVEAGARALRVPVATMEAMEAGALRLDVFIFADYLRALLDAEGVPRKGAACRCPAAPEEHAPGCRVHAMCVPGDAAP